MLEIVEMVYHNGVFVPEKPISLPEGARIQVVIDREGARKQIITDKTGRVINSHIQESAITDDDERKTILTELFKRWDENPIPGDAPRKFTREEIYERG